MDHTTTKQKATDSSELTLKKTLVSGERERERERAIRCVSRVYQLRTHTHTHTHTHTVMYEKVRE